MLAISSLKVNSLFLSGIGANFEFAVKFFEPNPEQLKNDYTRYSTIRHITFVRNTKLVLAQNGPYLMTEYWSTHIMHKL